MILQERAGLNHSPRTSGGCLPFIGREIRTHSNSRTLMFGLQLHPRCLLSLEVFSQAQQDLPLTVQGLALLAAVVMHGRHGTQCARCAGMTTCCAARCSWGSQ